MARRRVEIEATDTYDASLAAQSEARSLGGTVLALSEHPAPITGSGVQQFRQFVATIEYPDDDEAEPA